MKYVNNAIIWLLAFIASNAYSQHAKFVTSGVIEYEKTANMFAIVKKKVTKHTLDMKPHYEEYLRDQPQFLTRKSILSFDNTTTLFVPVKGESIYWTYDSPMANQLNIVYSDLSGKKSTIQKDFFERTYLVHDSLRKIKWKLTDETRIIAGYTCKRANGVLLDSIYAVAFYTDDIHVSGGPESFNGLPGMILGVAVPHENVTWFATKVTPGPVDKKVLVAPTKGKPLNNKQLIADILKAISNYGDYTMVALKGLIL
ncbi:MAG: GLPGLI family protein [Pedobacter sp.]